MPFGARRLAASLAELTAGWQGARFCVAYSGGLDSTVLLHALAALARSHPAMEIRAVHVDHGWQAGSGAWAASAARSCEAQGVALSVRPLAFTPPPGASPEAALRGARYAALAAELGAGEWLLTAHHRDDQLETVLIQLMRGAGVAGLAAMPARARFGAGWHGRPLLDVDRAALADYAAREELEPVLDPTNLSARFDRGWLRTAVLPALRSRWPAAAATVSRSARHLAEASRLLTELAASDAQGLVDGQRLSLPGLRDLSPDRRNNLLRWWIRACGLSPPPAARLAAGVSAFFDAGPGAQPMIRWADGELRRYRDRLYAMAPMPPAPREAIACGRPGDAEVPLGAGLGALRLVASESGGLRAGAAEAEIRFRAGGETLRPHPGRPRKRLKDLCQEAGIVPWMRERLPLVFVDGQLAAVGDLWIDADLAVPAGQPAWKPAWPGRPELY